MKAVAAVLAALLAVVVLMYVYTAPTQAPTEMSQAQIDQIETAVKQAATDQMNTWIAQEDLDAHVADHSDWAGNPWSGARSLQQMRDRQERGWAQYDWAVLAPPEWEVRVLGPEAAAVKGTLEMTRTDTAGVVFRHFADWAQVWVVEEGLWKLLVAREAVEAIQ